VRLNTRAPMRLRLTPPNPLRSEADAFGFLLWFVCLVAAIVVIALIIQAL
jgi:hypothetical protein